MGADLDNPVWSSLLGEQAALGRRAPHAARFYADVAPFVGVDVDAPRAGDELTELVAPGESVLFVGPVVPLSTSAWRVEPLESIAQMIGDDLRATPTDTAPIIE